MHNLQEYTIHIYAIYIYACLTSSRTIYTIHVHILCTYTNHTHVHVPFAHRTYTHMDLRYHPHALSTYIIYMHFTHAHTP